MFTRWNLERDPFYSRPIDKLTSNGFAGRNLEVNELTTYSKARGGVAIAMLYKYADSILPEILDTEQVKTEAVQKIASLIGKNKFSKKTNEILHYISNNPGANSTEISKMLNLSTSNLSKFVNPLIDTDLVERVNEGRVSMHYPIGLAKLLKSSYKS